MSKLIPLTQGKFAIVDDEDYEWLSKLKWGFNKCAVRRNGVLMHRLIMNAPKGMVVDHINRDRLDNRKSNLRLCTQAENVRNMRRLDNEVGYVGVTKTKEWKKTARPYKAVLDFNKTRYYLGRFETAEEAAYARDYLARDLYGEFVELNFPEVPPIKTETE